MERIAQYKITIEKMQSLLNSVTTAEDTKAKYLNVKPAAHSFFSLMLQEITGSGHPNNIDFNIYLRDKNRRYLQAIIENVYFPDEKTGKTFFKDKEPFYFVPRMTYSCVFIHSKLPLEEI